MKKSGLFLLLTILLSGTISCSSARVNNSIDLTIARENINRAIAITDSTVGRHMNRHAMARFYNPYTQTLSEETASVWMYTSSIEAVNAILRSLKTLKEYGDEPYNTHFNRYVELLASLYEDMAYYKGTFTLTSYTQTKEWTIYGVDRGRRKGAARVEGIYNVYDDQQWLVRELLESYKVTGNKKYLEQAEYLTEYVMDGWDCTLDSNGNENGGITWGPGYITKHACSNGPMVSPLVWLYELYKDSDEKLTYIYIDTDQSRKTREMLKSEYYLKYAQAVYQWQKDHLLRADGVYADMMGGCEPDCNLAYETINGQSYRKHNPLKTPTGRAYTYNCGTMLSGGADLYRVTNDPAYQEDIKKLSDASFAYFAKPGTIVADHYTYPTGGFSNWFNGVMLRGYIDVFPSYKEVDKNINTFQQNLDYGYTHFLYNGFLPTNLLAGWKEEQEENDTEAMFSFTFAAEYAILAQHALEKEIK